MGRLTAILFLILPMFSACGNEIHRVPPVKSWTISENALLLEADTVLTGLSEAATVCARGERAGGVFLTFSTGESGKGIKRWNGLRIAGAEKFLALWRMKPWWTQPVWPADETVIPSATEALLWRRHDGRYGILLPILDKGYRFSLEGDSLGLTVAADNNLPDGPAGAGLTGIYLAQSADPYILIDRAFDDVVKRMGVGNLREKKPEPVWIDWLGYASWYSFFEDVTEDKFQTAIKSLKQAGVNPGWVLLDAGWQDRTRDGNLIRSFGPDKTKFPHGLEWLVEKVARDYGIPYFLVWHTLEGCWRGIDSLSVEMARYTQYASDGRSNQPIAPLFEKWLRGRWNVPRPEAALAFFYDFYSFLATSGVDGVKVDNQSELSYMTYGLGPMTEVMGQFVRAMEESATAHFGPGNVIDCMSMVQDALYQYRYTSIARTSTDFFPDSAASWGPHMVINAYNSLFWGEIIRPDWDMWKSVHPAAAYHAAGRVISGGPVYISDEPGKHDAGLIRQVALPDGRLLRPKGVPRPTVDILFRNPEIEPVLLTVFNGNGNGTYLLGAFHANYLSDESISGWISPGLIPGLEAGRLYAVRSILMKTPRLMTINDSVEIRLDKGGFSLFTISPVDRGVALLGLEGENRMFNHAGVFEKSGWLDSGTFVADILTGGEIEFYSDKQPQEVETSSGGCRFIFGGGGMPHILRVICSGPEPRRITIRF